MKSGNIKIVNLNYSDSITLTANNWTTLFNITEKPVATAISSANDANGNSFLIRLNNDGNLQIYTSKNVTTAYILGNLTYV